MDYGTGAIFGCPAHDQRDLDFANTYGLPVLPVVLPDGENPKNSALLTRHILARASCLIPRIGTGLILLLAKRLPSKQLPRPMLESARQTTG